MAKGFIQLLCEKYRFTQKELAEYTGVPVRTIENWAYRNNCPIYLKTLIEDYLEHQLMLSVASEMDQEFVEEVFERCISEAKHYKERFV